MKFTFSEQFRQSACESLLRDIGDLTDRLRLCSGCNVKKMMADIHISYPTLKKY